MWYDRFFPVEIRDRFRSGSIGLSNIVPDIESSHRLSCSYWLFGASVVGADAKSIDDSRICAPSAKLPTAIATIERRAVDSTTPLCGRYNEAHSSSKFTTLVIEFFVLLEFELVRIDRYATTCTRFLREWQGYSCRLLV